jgi:predicted nucleic acid-binding protein
VTYLLDVNALLALGFVKHVHHQRVTNWLRMLQETSCDPLFVFLDDGVGIEVLPEWVTRSSQVTDGHLLQVARAHRARLATLDTQIPNADLIVDDPYGPMTVRDSATEPSGWYSASP